jgi:transcriptional regulator with XRE-family HTH domain
MPNPYAVSSNEFILTSAQCRAARAYLGWSQQELAEKSGVFQTSISKFECERGITPPSTMRNIKYALQEAGFELPENGGIIPVKGFALKKHGASTGD